MPEPTEKIRYGMPAVMLGGRYALHYAGWKKHIGLYPVPTLPEPLEAEIAPYRAEKDSVVFPHTKPVPYELIGRVTRCDRRAARGSSGRRSRRARSIARACRSTGSSTILPPYVKTPRSPARRPATPLRPGQVLLAPGR